MRDPQAKTLVNYQLVEEMQKKSKANKFPGQAIATEAKQAVIARLEHTWLKNPQLRLGELLLDAVRSPELFYYLEDEELIKRLELFQPNIRIPYQLNDMLGSPLTIGDQVAVDVGLVPCFTARIVSVYPVDSQFGATVKVDKMDMLLCRLGHRLLLLEEYMVQSDPFPSTTGSITSDNCLFAPQSER